MKKVLFYLPVALVFGIFAYFLYAFRGNILNNLEIFLAQLGVVAVFLLSAIVLNRGHWFGCIPEIFLGLWFIWMGVHNQSSVMDEALLGGVLAAYYAVCGVVAWRSGKKG